MAFTTAYTTVTWTAGDIITEAKLDSMVANDQSYDAHAAQGLELDETTTPSTPSSGTVRIYAKDKSGVSALYALNDAGAEREIVNEDGWKEAGETWTYASASTITVPTGAANRYKKGDKIKWTQTTVKYGVIVTVADTLLTIAVNTDYVVTNAAISLNYYSHQASPIGFPTRFAYTPNFTGFSAVPTGQCYYSIDGGICTVWINADTPGTSDATTLTFIVPVASTVGSAYFDGLVYNNSGWVDTNGRGSISGATVSVGINSAGGAWTNTGGKMWLGQFSYAI